MAMSALSVPPGKDFTVHIRALWPGTYLALPLPAVTRVLAAVGGMGILMTTFSAFRLALKSADTLILTVSLLFPSSGCC